MLRVSEAVGQKAVVRLLAEVVSLVEPRLLEFWKTTGITFGQRRLLRRLREGPLTAGALAADLGIAAPSLTRQLQRLEEDGLISRAVDREDRRRVTVTLTAAGHAVLNDHKVFGGSPLALAVRDLGLKQQRDLARDLEALIILARKHVENADE